MSFFSPNFPQEDTPLYDCIFYFYNDTQLTSLLPKLAPETKYSKFDRHLSLSLETVTWSRSHLFASPAPSKSSQPSGCAGMCGIYYLLLALNDCWCECCDGPLLHLLWLSMLWTNQDSALCCAKVKKETLSFCQCTHNVALHCLFMRTHG